jgi:diadenosine tetraphosphate (Ap4A) HIT family hydrolase
MHKRMPEHPPPQPAGAYHYRRSGHDATDSTESFEDHQTSIYTTSPRSNASSTRCLLCDVLAERRDTPARSFISPAEMPSEILSRAGSFVAISDVAPLAPGHMLLVTDRHLSAMGRLTTSELTALSLTQARFAHRLESIYSTPVVAFEHGLCSTNSVGSCGIDHAHLHLMPTHVQIEQKFRDDFTTSSLQHLADLAKEAGDQEEYLLLMTPAGKSLIAYLQAPRSQYFRKAIGIMTHQSFWNWNDAVLLGQAAQRKDWILRLHKNWNESCCSGNHDNRNKLLP